MDHDPSERVSAATTNWAVEPLDKENGECNGQLRAQAPPDVPRPPTPGSSENGSVSTPNARDSRNPLDIDGLCLSQDFTSQIGVRNVRSTVPVRNPNRQEFVRAHPEDAYRLQTMVLQLKEPREYYLVLPELWGELSAELRPVALVTAVNRQAAVFLWPLRLPDTDGRVDSWCASALAAADRARTRWVRVKSNFSLSAYEVVEATGQLSDPQWPAESLQLLIEIAFRDRVINSLDHPVICRLRGEL